MGSTVSNKHKNFWFALSTLAVFSLGYFLFTRFSNPLPESSVIKKIANEKELKAVFENAGSRMLVFDLYADWCGPCRVIHPTLEALASKYAGKVDFFQINIDENPAIANTFMVRNIPYVVFFKDKQKIISLVGINPVESYEKVITACDTVNGPCGKDFSDITK